MSGIGGPSGAGSGVASLIAAASTGSARGRTRRGRGVFSTGAGRGGPSQGVEAHRARSSSRREKHLVEGRTVDGGGARRGGLGDLEGLEDRLVQRGCLDLVEHRHRVGGEGPGGSGLDPRLDDLLRGSVEVDRDVQGEDEGRDRRAMDRQGDREARSALTPPAALAAASVGEAGRRIGRGMARWRSNGTLRFGSADGPRFCSIRERPASLAVGMPFAGLQPTAAWRPPLPGLPDHDHAPRTAAPAPRHRDPHPRDRRRADVLPARGPRTRKRPARRLRRPLLGARASTSRRPS